MSRSENILTELRAQEEVVRGVVYEEGIMIWFSDGRWTLTKLGLERFNEESGKLNILANRALALGLSKEEVYNIQRKRK